MCQRQIFLSEEENYCHKIKITVTKKVTEESTKTFEIRAENEAEAYRKVQDSIEDDGLEEYVNDWDMNWPRVDFDIDSVVEN